MARTPTRPRLTEHQAHVLRFVGSILAILFVIGLFIAFTNVMLWVLLIFCLFVMMVGVVGALSVILWDLTDSKKDKEL